MFILGPGEGKAAAGALAPDPINPGAGAIALTGADGLVAEVRPVEALGCGMRTPEVEETMGVGPDAPGGVDEPTAAGDAAGVPPPRPKPFEPSSRQLRMST